MRQIVPILVVLLLALVAACSSAPPKYTVNQAVSDMTTQMPTSPFLNRIYDRCVASYLFDHESPDRVRTTIQRDIGVGLMGAPPILVAAEDNPTCASLAVADHPRV